MSASGSVASRSLIARAECRRVWLYSGFQSVITTLAWVKDQTGQVEAFVADPAVKRLDVTVAPGLSGRDERQADSFTGPVPHHCARQLRAVVTAQHPWIAVDQGDPVQLISRPTGPR